MTSPYDLSESLLRLNALDMRIIGFGIFYGDGGSFFGLTLKEWKQAPKENVQLILLYYSELDSDGNNYRHSICSWDYYAFDGKTFTASNDTRNLCSEHILYGKWMDSKEWKKIVENALNNYEKFDLAVG